LNKLEAKINISIIVPCYNQAQFLSEALESVINQTYKNWECIIVNDGSTDHTEDVAKQWLNKDNRFSYVKIENGGLSNARNVGIENAIGEYILPLDADDKIGERYLELAIEKFDVNSYTKVIYSNAKMFGAKEGELVLKPFSLKNLAKKNMIFCSAIFRKRDWEKVGGYDVKMTYGYEDWELWINMLKNGGEVVKLNEFCFFYRIKENSMLLNLDKKKKKYLYDYLSVKHTVFFIENRGNFFDLYNENIKRENHLKYMLKSKKHAVNVLSKALLNIKIFKHIND